MSGGAMALARAISFALASALVAFDRTIRNAFVNVMPRPQYPRKRPYVVRTVRLPGGGDGISLAGELTMPTEGGPFPAMVLVPWGGPSDRNEAVDGHKPFLVLSDRLTRRGFAVLRCDKRGVGKSGGVFSTASTMDFAADAGATLGWLRTQPSVDAGRAGYVGHSAGGCVAALAAQIERPDFMVLLAVPSQPLSDGALLQETEISRASGMRETAIAEHVGEMARLLDILRKSPTLGEARDQIVGQLRDFGASEYQIRTFLDEWVTPWGRWVVEFDPLRVLSQYDGPALALYGGRDLHVSAAANAPDMKSALTHAVSDVLVQPELNHMFQPSETGLPEEIWKTRTTFDEGTMNMIADWLDNALH